MKTPKWKLAYIKRWQKRNRKKVIGYSRKWNLSNNVRVRMYQEKWGQIHPDKIKCKNRNSERRHTKEISRRYLNRLGYPPELHEAKRAQLKLLREVRKN